jgi:hypothetical protein
MTAAAAFCRCLAFSARLPLLERADISAAISHHCSLRTNHGD